MEYAGFVHRENAICSTTYLEYQEEDFYTYTSETNLKCRKIAIPGVQSAV